MPTAPPFHRAHGRRTQPLDVRSRGSARSRGYDATWEKARAEHLRAHPLCGYCALKGKVAGATLVDHLYPHRGAVAVFWFKPWWVSSCATCHSGEKQAIERAGRAALDRLAQRLGLPTWSGGPSAGGGG